jgi:hypothetical protein
VRQNLPSRRRSASQHEAEAPGPGPDTATERAILASIFENPREALERPSLRWLCANAPRSFSDPLVGAAAAEVHRQGLEANLASVIQSLEAAEQITADARGYLVSLAAEALPVDLAEADAARLVETRRPAQLAATLREAADQIEHVPQRAPEILGVMRETIDTLAQEGPRRPCRYIARPIAELARPEADDPDELLRHRFLCRGGGLLLCAPTGIGKSTLAIQFALSWGIGREALGIAPARPLRSLYIQAENDAGDLAELRDGIADGMEFSDVDRAQAFERVSFATVDDLCGLAFIGNAFTPLLEQHRPDVVFVDPLLSYIGGDVTKQEVVSPWLRNGINPVLHRTGTGLILVHHVNKPATGEAKREWKAGDFAYIGSGSADLANWARAVIAIRSIGDHSVFELHLGKRGKRVGWTDPDGTPLYSRRIAHGTDGIYWREAQADEGPAPAGRRAGATPEQLAALLDGKELTTTDWRALAGDELGVSRTAFYRIKNEAESRKLITRSKVSDRWMTL